jgi:phytoene dehydrogenase-like protein
MSAASPTVSARAAAHCDALIIGGGHNGLVCAAYLAAAGLKVTVLERRAVVGGAAVTEEFHPGFRNSVAAYAVSLLNPKVIRDLDLPGHGLRVVERRCANFLPSADGRYLLTGEGRTQSEVARFSSADAARLPAYWQRLEAVADVLRELALTTPPNVTSGSWREALPELIAAARLGGRLRRLDIGLQRELLALLAMSAGDYLVSAERGGTPLAAWVRSPRRWRGRRRRVAWRSASRRRCVRCWSKGGGRSA